MSLTPGDPRNSVTVDFEDGLGNALAKETATDTDTVLPPIDLTITKSDGGITAQPGDTVVYTLTYDQVGTQDLTGVTITETVPHRTPRSHRGPPRPVGYPHRATRPGSTCTFSVGALAAADGPATVEFAVVVDDPYATGVPPLSNTASIADDGTFGADPNSGDNVSIDTTPIIAGPALTVTKVDTPSAAEPLDAADTIDYTITVTNDGNLSATNVIVTDTPVGTVTIDTDQGVAARGIDHVDHRYIGHRQPRDPRSRPDRDAHLHRHRRYVAAGPEHGGQPGDRHRRSEQQRRVSDDPSVGGPERSERRAAVEHDVQSRSHEDVGCNRTGRAWRRDHLHRHRHEHPARTP